MHLTGRQKREQQYHDAYAASLDVTESIDFGCVDGPRNGTERRPWNAYWALLERVLEEYDAIGGRSRILDFGCGSGYYAVLYAHIGFEVDGFDISEKSVEFARRRAREFGYGDKINLAVGTGEQLAYQDEVFDVLCGIDILHHLDDIPAAIEECLRVLKPGGVVFFKEFFKALAWDRLRNTRLVQTITPNTASYDFEGRYVTEDEEKLGPDDLEAIRAIAPSMEVEYFRIFARLSNISLISSKLQSAEVFLSRKAWTDKLDRWLIDRFSVVERLCGEGIICLRKPAR